ncbi:MAG: ribosome biogenesis GTPase Der [Actinomycetaceae bacterium]|nr:ribosome biogenesis GTPase Der [Actinomycetaceae bacterium]
MSREGAEREHAARDEVEEADVEAIGFDEWQHFDDEWDGADESDLDERRRQVLRSNLEGYELTEEDLAVLDGLWEQEDEPGPVLPVLAVVGRPNVGKSSLVNRIVGRRVAVVQDTPGVTRDRVSYPATWSGRDFTLVDTGGWETDVAGIDAAVARQAEAAIEAADAVVLVVDANVGITDADAEIVTLLRRSGRPVVLAANKVDSAVQESDAAVLWGLGLGEPYPISAMHGRGMGTLLDAITDALPEVSAVARPAPALGPRRVALVGRPNVGKSSLLNQLAGAERVVVDPLAGTTRDPVDELITLDGRPWTFVDTAGIRRRVHTVKGADFYASLRTQAALSKAELALVLIDASQPLTEQDVRVMQQAIDAGRALVLVCNKWDLVDQERREELDRELERDLVQIRWAERVNVSAKTGWHTNRLTRVMDTALASWDQRIPTGRLNSFLGELAAAHPHPVRSGRQPRILFATQVSARPPRFVLFSSGFLQAGYRRFIENQLREHFGFQGTPIQISVRERERRKKRR